MNTTAHQLNRVIGLFCLLAVLFILPIATQAQSDSKAQMILLDAYQKFQGLNSMKLTFTTVSKSSSQSAIKSKRGTCYIKGEQHVVELPDRKIISDGNTTWTYMRSQKKMYVRNFDPNEVSLNPDVIFRPDFLMKGFVYKYVTNPGKERSYTASYSSRREDTIDLIPEKEKKDFSKIRVFVDQQTKQINRWKVYQKDGKIVDYELNIIPNYALASNFFESSKSNLPKGVQVIDMRK